MSRMGRNRPEVKVIDRDGLIQLSYPVGNPTTSTSPEAQVNRWIALFQDPDEPTSSLLAHPYRAASTSVADTRAAISAYNASPLALTIPQGTQANQRLGAEVNIVSDKFKFTWYCHPVDPTDSRTLTNSTGVLPRRIKIRMLGIYQPYLLEPGNIGYLPAELFEKTDDIRSHFKRGDATGYRVIYDKTKTLGLFCSQSTIANRTHVGPYEVTFATKAAYKKKWALASNDSTSGETNAAGNTAGTEITLDTDTLTNTLRGGVSKGQILWYYFIEDLLPYHDAATADKWHYPQFGFGCDVKRRVYFTDA